MAKKKRQQFGSNWDRRSHWSTYEAHVSARTTKRERPDFRAFNLQLEQRILFTMFVAFLPFPPRISFAFCAKVGHRMFHPPSELCWIAGSILEMLVGFCLGLTYGLQVLPCLSFSSNGWHFHTIPLDP